MARNCVFTNGQLFVPTDNARNDITLSNSFVIENDKIAFVGNKDDEAIKSAIETGASVVDLSQQIVVPGFIDSHAHFLLFGLSLQKLDLDTCTSLQAVQESITKYAHENPNLSRILCRGWHQAATGGKALATTIDPIDPRPVFIEAFDLHSTWCNTAALRELGVTSSTKVEGGTVHKDSEGNPSGLLDENAQINIVWPFLMGAYSMEEKLIALRSATKAYTEAGYAGFIDMAMDEIAWTALEKFRDEEGLPLHVAAHWIIPFSKNISEIRQHLDKAIAMHKSYHPSKSPTFCVVGIKLIADGVVDGCTAAFSSPYQGKSDPVEPVWPYSVLEQVVKEASNAGLQIAVHAIGDVAIKQAIDAIASANSPAARHRIEHLEFPTDEDKQRLGLLGITASVQPVHSDPALAKSYPALIQPHLWERAFPYHDFTKHKAHLAIGTDAPTARHFPLPNLYNATTRRSALEPDMKEALNPEYAVTLSQAVVAATSGAAYSRFAETWTGSLLTGHRADFLILEMDWMPERLLQAKLKQNWIGGSLIYESDK